MKKFIAILALLFSLGNAHSQVYSSPEVDPNFMCPFMAGIGARTVEDLAKAKRQDPVAQNGYYEAMVGAMEMKLAKEAKVPPSAIIAASKMVRFHKYEILNNYKVLKLLPSKDVKEHILNYCYRNFDLF